MPKARSVRKSLWRRRWLRSRALRATIGRKPRFAASIASTTDDSAERPRWLSGISTVSTTSPKISSWRKNFVSVASRGGSTS